MDSSAGYYGLGCQLCSLDFEYLSGQLWVSMLLYITQLLF